MDLLLHKSMMKASVNLDQHISEKEEDQYTNNDLNPATWKLSYLM